jgi:hypothetical protein
LTFVGGRIVCLKAQKFQTPSSSSTAKAFMTSTTQQTLASVSSSSADVKHCLGTKDMETTQIVHNTDEVSVFDVLGTIRLQQIVRQRSKQMVSACSVPLFWQTSLLAAFVYDWFLHSPSHEQSIPSCACGCVQQHDTSTASDNDCACTSSISFLLSRWITKFFESNTTSTTEHSSAIATNIRMVACQTMQQKFSETMGHLIQQQRVRRLNRVELCDCEMICIPPRVSQRVLLEFWSSIWTACHEKEHVDILRDLYECWRSQVEAFLVTKPTTTTTNNSSVQEKIHATTILAVIITTDWFKIAQGSFQHVPNSLMMNLSVQRTSPDLRHWLIRQSRFVLPKK